MIAHFTPFPEIKTGRLLLRKLSVEVSELLLQLRSDETVNKYLDRPKTTTIEECIAYIHKIDALIRAGLGTYWVISFKDDKRLIGAICFWNFDPNKDSAELGYELSPAYHGKGLMTEAIASVVAFGFELMKLKVILAFPHHENKGSRRLLEKADFAEDLNDEYAVRADLGEHVVYFLKV